MSKKKKHIKRRKGKKAKRYNPYSLDRHHFLWTKSVWSRRYAQKLRMHEYCVVFIPQSTLHKQIHMDMTGIPLASEANCKAVLEALERDMVKTIITMSDLPSKRLKWLIYQFNECEPATADALRKQLDIVLDYEWRQFLVKLP